MIWLIHYGLEDELQKELKKEKFPINRFHELSRFSQKTFDLALESLKDHPNDLDQFLARCSKAQFPMKYLGQYLNRFPEEINNVDLSVGVDWSRITSYESRNRIYSLSLNEDVCYEIASLAPYYLHIIKPFAFTRRWYPLVAKTSHLHNYVKRKWADDILPELVEIGDIWMISDYLRNNDPENIDFAYAVAIFTKDPYLMRKMKANGAKLTLEYIQQFNLPKYAILMSNVDLFDEMLALGAEFPTDALRYCRNLLFVDRIHSVQPIVNAATMDYLLQSKRRDFLVKVFNEFTIEPDRSYIKTFVQRKCIMPLLPTFLRKPELQSIRQYCVNYIMNMPRSYRTKFAIESTLDLSILSRIHFNRTSDVEALLRADISLMNIEIPFVSNTRVRKLLLTRGVKLV